ncbi:MAG: hypothetical protein KatS3mg111_0491 [Pirellulaceae bacterium]|nr:MAG: hypothetical protein KatS3mg111_0491 [Pirellulaceae bacterium]
MVRESGTTSDHRAALQWCHWSRGQYAYCYAICYPTGVPLYIGKGRALRMLQHAAELRSTTIRPRLLSPQAQELHRLQRAGWQELYAVLGTGDNTAMLGLEAQIIAYFGTRDSGGVLFNRRDEAARSPRAESWLPPTPIAIHADGTAAGVRWLYHPDVDYRQPAHKGLIASCPTCGEQYMHTANRPLRGGWCPHCHHWLGEDNAAIHAQWSADRPALNETRRYPPKVATPQSCACVYFGTHASALFKLATQSSTEHGPWRFL